MYASVHRLDLNLNVVFTFSANVVQSGLSLTFSGSAELEGGLPTPDSTATVPMGVQFTCDGRAVKTDLAITFSGTGLSEYSLGFTYEGKATFDAQNNLVISGSTTLTDGSQATFTCEGATYVELASGGFRVEGSGKDISGGQFSFSVVAQFKQEGGYFSITGTGSATSLPASLMTTVSGGPQDVACVGSGTTSTQGQTITFDGSGQTGVGVSYTFTATGALGSSGELQTCSGNGKTVQGCTFTFDVTQITATDEQKTTFKIQVTATLICEQTSTSEYTFEGSVSINRELKAFTFVGTSLQDIQATTTALTTTPAAQPEVVINGKGTTNQDRSELQFEGSGFSVDNTAVAFTATVKLGSQDTYTGSGSTSKGEQFQLNFTVTTSTAESFSLNGVGRYVCPLII